jgi:hypothetical protein
VSCVPASTRRTAPTHYSGHVYKWVCRASSLVASGRVKWPLRPDRARQRLSGSVWPLLPGTSGGQQWRGMPDAWRWGKTTTQARECDSGAEGGGQTVTKTHRGWGGHTVWKVQYLLMCFVPDVLVWMRFTHVQQTHVLFIRINKSRNGFRTAALAIHCKKSWRIWNTRLSTEGRFVSETPKYDYVKTRLCLERRKVLRTEQNPEDSLKTVFLEDVLPLANNSSFLRIGHTVLPSWLRWERLNFYIAAELLPPPPLLDGTFKSCPRQFAQLCSSDADLVTTAHENCTYPVWLYFYRTKMKQNSIVC